MYEDFRRAKKRGVTFVVYSLEKFIVKLVDSRKKKGV